MFSPELPQVLGHIVAFCHLLFDVVLFSALQQVVLKYVRMQFKFLGMNFDCDRSVQFA